MRGIGFNLCFFFPAGLPGAFGGGGVFASASEGIELHDADYDNGDRHNLCQREAGYRARGSAAEEFDEEPFEPCEYEVDRKEPSGGPHPRPELPYDSEDDEYETDLVELGRVDGDVRRGKTFRERHRPWHVGRDAVVVAYEKAADAPYGVCKREGRGGQIAYRPHADLVTIGYYPGEYYRPEEPAVEREAAPRKEARSRVGEYLGKRDVLENVEELCAEYAAEHGREEHVADDFLIELLPFGFDRYDPVAREKAEGHHRAEARDAEISYADQLGIH